MLLREMFYWNNNYFGILYNEDREGIIRNLIKRVCMYTFRCIIVLIEK